MFATQFKGIFKATAQVQGASVKGMKKDLDAAQRRSSDSGAMLTKTGVALRFCLAISAILLLQFFILAPMARAAAAQSNVEMGPQSEAASLPPAFGESLRPALAQVGSSVGQIHIDRWKLSRNWKAQLQSDADSIQQDLSHQLPALFEQAQASPTALDAQMRVMQNVDALYDVMVRLTMAANLTEKKTDAAMLDNALQRLESARKAASGQMLQAASLQGQQIVHLRMQVEGGQTGEPVSTGMKTIVVDNSVVHHARHRTRRVRKPKPVRPASKSSPAPPPSTVKGPS